MIARGFGAAAVLMLLVLVLFVIARLIGGRGPGDLSKRQQRARLASSKRGSRRASKSTPPPAARGREHERADTGPSRRLMIPAHRAMCPGAIHDRRPLRHPRVHMAARLLAVLSVFFAGRVRADQRRPAAASYVPISGAGSTWTQNALDQWIRNVDQYGIKVNYAGTGSSDGRNQFRNGTVDFAVSEIPYGITDSGVVDTAADASVRLHADRRRRHLVHVQPAIGGQRVTNLRLSGETITKIFTGNIKHWNDPAIEADNPGLALPARRDRAGGALRRLRYDGAVHHLDEQEVPRLWNAYCQKAGRSSPCGVTSNFPVAPGLGFVAQSGSSGVAGYIAQQQSEGTITYVEYSYALNSRLPGRQDAQRGRLLHRADSSERRRRPAQGTDQQRPELAAYLTQMLDGVYTNPDPRTYPLSSYSYMIIPTAT